ncbi:hypothetical protein BDV96DRAFT_601782 [Lophiotrema nucula]|uniref:Uncharacterized protein n=1 Tax=Lophiotrema nucula TaxID=690887 RepID=A0A6A5Z299_9PLEO|nr:hypothetical protein BDV96DRAFT_601782 [Lophiotrema nucula]
MANIVLHSTVTYLDNVLDGLFEYGRQAGYFMQLYKIMILSMLHVDLSMIPIDSRNEVLKPVVDAVQIQFNVVWAYKFHGDIEEKAVDIIKRDINDIIKLVKKEVADPLDLGDLRAKLFGASLLEVVKGVLKPEHIKVNSEKHAWYTFRLEQSNVQNGWPQRLKGYWPTMDKGMAMESRHAHGIGIGEA